MLGVSVCLQLAVCWKRLIKIKTGIFRDNLSTTIAVILILDFMIYAVRKELLRGRGRLLCPY